MKISVRAFQNNVRGASIQVAGDPSASKTTRMTAQDLARSATSDASPPASYSTTARTLWFAKAGQWDAAHDLCQEIQGSAGSWIHAYLHREEGDHANAAYWYARAGKPVPIPATLLADEWLEIATALLEHRLGGG